MTWDSGTIAAVFQGLAALLTVLGLSAAGRSRRSALDRGEYRQLQRVELAWLTYGSKLERLIVAAGRPAPERPKILEERYGPAFGGGDGDGGNAPAPEAAV
jgi:hypothetical protein